MGYKFIRVILFAILLMNKMQGQPFFTVGAGTNDVIRGMYADDATNTLYVGGQFSHTGNIPCAAIAKWNGIAWDSTRNQLVNFVRSFQRFKNEIYIGGAIAFFDSSGILIGPYIAKWDSTNGYWIKFCDDANGSTFELIANDSNLIVTGQFDSIGGIYSPKIARYDGNNWYGYPPLDVVGGGFTAAAAVYYNGDLYVGGNFESQQGPNMKDIAKWNGTQWQSVGGGLSGPFTWVNAFAIYQGKLIVAGGFFTSSGDPGNGVAAWDGTSWSQLGTGVGPGQVFCLQVYNNELYVGGYIYDAGGIPVSHIAKWDGTQWQSLGITLDNAVNTMAVLDNDLYIGGAFLFMNGDTVHHIIRYNYLTGFEAIEKLSEELYVSPNPGNELCNITAPSFTNSTLLLYDITGRILMQQSFTAKAELDISSFTKGVYIVEIKNKKDETVKGKIVKN